MKTKRLSLLFIFALLVIFNSCTKEQVDLNEAKYDQLVLSQDDIENIEYEEFFELAKGDTIPKGVFREKPLVAPEDEIMVLYSSEDINPRATGNSTSTSGYIKDLKCSIRNDNNAPDPWPTNDDYHKIPVDLNEGAGGKYIYLYYKKNSYGGDAISYINVRTNCCLAPVSVSYPYMKKLGLAFSNGRWTDLNQGAGGHYIKLEGSEVETTVAYINHQLMHGLPVGWIPPDYLTPIKDILIISSTSRLSSFEDWIFINADLNKGAGGKYIYLCYKKDAMMKK
jgi:hypothetical protein